MRNHFRRDVNKLPSHFFLQTLAGSADHESLTTVASYGRTSRFAQRRDWLLVLNTENVLNHSRIFLRG